MLGPQLVRLLSSVQQQQVVHARHLPPGRRGWYPVLLGPKADVSGASEPRPSVSQWPNQCRVRHLQSLQGPPAHLRCRPPPHFLPHLHATLPCAIPPVHHDVYISSVKDAIVGMAGHRQAVTESTETNNSLKTHLLPADNPASAQVTGVTPCQRHGCDASDQRHVPGICYEVQATRASGQLVLSILPDLKLLLRRQSPPKSLHVCMQPRMLRDIT